MGTSRDIPNSPAQLPVVGQSLLSVDIGHRVLLIEKVSLHVSTTSRLDLGNGETFSFGGLHQGFCLIAKIGLVLVQAQVANDFLYAIVQPIRYTSHLHVPFSQCFSLLPECSTRFPLEGLRCQAFFTNAAAVFVHGGVGTLATAAEANGHLVFSVMRRR